MYFAALLARTEDGWEASDTELDDVETLSDLTDLARENSVDDDTVLVYVEQEDSWFGIVRVEGEDDPRIFVSDAAAAARSAYGEILLTDELVGRDPGTDDGTDLDTLDLDGTEDGEPDADGSADEPSGADDSDAEGTDGGPLPAAPVGDAAILADLGVSEADLLTMEGGDTLAEIAESLGAAEVLEAVR